MIHLKREEEILKQSANIFKEAFEEINYDLQERFCDANDLKFSMKNNNVPKTILNNFFSELFSFKRGFSENKSNTDDQETEEIDEFHDMQDVQYLKINSIFQSMYYIFYKARKLTPLQTLISLRIHNLVKCKRTVTSFNHMGLGISYQDVERIKNKLALFSAKKYGKDMPLPSHMNPETFTWVAIDNFDHLEGTFSGLYSTHDTVIVFFQVEDKNYALAHRKPKMSTTDVDSRACKMDVKLLCQQLVHSDFPPGEITFPENYFINMNTGVLVNSEDYEFLNAKDIAYTLRRLDLADLPEKLQHLNVQVIPPWSAFNSILTTDTRPKHTYGFQPIMPHPITKKNVVNSLLTHLLKLLNDTLKQEFLPVYCDEGVYHLAKEIQLATGKKYEKLLILLGDFHLIKTGLACIGKYLRDSGIEHLLVESGMFGINVVDKVSHGSNYARSIKGFLYLAEILERLQLKEFFKQETESFENELALLIELQETFNAGEFEESKLILKNFEIQAEKFIESFQKFNKDRSAQSPLYKYWDNVLKMIRVIRDLLRANRS